MRQAESRNHGLVVLAVLLLSACGGPNGPQGPQNQSISFGTQGTVSGAVGTSVTNIASGGAGTGVITYASSNATVAAVNATTGAAQLLTVGSATITATKAADANYNQAIATYALNVTPGSQSIAFVTQGTVTGAVGTSATNIASGGAGIGAITYSSSNATVATVNAITGAAQLLTVGNATITATKAADANYNQAIATYGLSVTPGSQSIAFGTQGTVTGAVGTSATNIASGGAGTGVITYASSNAAVATVNATTGAAQLLTVGSATITATKAADPNYNQATATYALNVTPGSQSIAFVQSGPLQLLKGFALTNTASGGAGTGAITYASSNTNAITVDVASGAATAVAAGSATITAIKAADANYTQAQATYSLTVQTQAPVSAWIGPSDAQVTLPGIATGAQFIRARDRNCNLANYSTCTMGQQTLVAGPPITDTAANTTATGYYWLQNGNAATNPLPVSIKRFSERIGHAALFFNNRYWVIGGSFLDSPGAKNDVWSSADGRTWELETSNAGFAQRWIFQSVVYNGKMWVIGGISSTNGLTNDVWSSTDGKNWVQVATATPFLGSHQNLTVTVFNNAMWAVFNGDAYSSTDGITWTLKSATGAIGGSVLRGFASLTAYAGKLWYVAGAPNFATNTSGNAANDVWSSSDGVNWTQVTANANFSPRYEHAAFVMNNRLWVFGGSTVTNGVQGTWTPDAWSTTDGVNWTQEAAPNGLVRSRFMAAVQETNKVTLVGGATRAVTNKVWQSTDGNHWTELSSFAAFSPRSENQALEFLGDLWLIGGFVSETVDTNEIWRSTDGMNWTQVTPGTAVFSPRDAHQAIVFNGRLWVIGGWDNIVGNGGTDTRFNDVWSSADGINWIKQNPATAIFSPRVLHQAVVFNNKLWIIGGNTATTAYVNDVWSTADGVNWVQETASAAFAARGGHSVVAFNNTLWLFGGQNSTTAFGDIWKSTDGVNWTIVTPAGAGPAARSGHAAAIYNNRIWITGGWNGLDWNGNDYQSATRFNDVWSTTDGVTWIQNTAAAQFDPRVYPGFANHNSELWLIGGLNFDRFNEVWRSTDGVNWRVGFKQNFTTQ